MLTKSKLTHVSFKNLACYYLIYRDILEARIRLDLVNFLARSGSKQKFNSSRLARLGSRKNRLDPALTHTLKSVFCVPDEPSYGRGHLQLHFQKCSFWKCKKILRSSLECSKKLFVRRFENDTFESVFLKV